MNCCLKNSDGLKEYPTFDIDTLLPCSIFQADNKAAPLITIVKIIAHFKQHSLIEESISNINNPMHEMNHTYYMDQH